ncbi:hypothetical protein BKA70DRAFT_1575997 [Coprinopsis sp. MPI-PUGE-AT-0042]|nr:hypothetical protein BKA70DRAFT_1575997 [Coprinopsis sp. MPI-PUGE-AT-0042]
MVLARLVTAGKALAATDGGVHPLNSLLRRIDVGTAVVLTNEMIRDYVLNYGRPLIYTTSLSLSSITAADASLTMLSDGTAARLSSKLLDITSYFTSSLHSTSSTHTSSYYTHI